tara:strand:- start:1929 stop:3149 length:1221 start_codon:yes stop_codon:yes gene_type:complete
MMMNDFGVPMSDAEMNMQPIKPHEKLMAESGVEMNLTNLIPFIGPAISVVGSIIGGNKASKSAKSQVEAQNSATDAQFKYDNELHRMNQSKLIADREEAIKAIEAKQKNEGKRAGFLDANAKQQYKYQLQIRNREQTSLNQQYLKSEDIYSTQTSLNAVSEKQAVENELRKYQEIQAESAFDKEEQRIEQLKAEGQFRAKGISGRSADKAQQVTGADYGRLIAQINEATSAAGRNTRAVLNEIATDKLSADLSAEAAKMLHPGVLPETIKPFATPTAEYVLPRELEDFDFGPEPVKGAIYSKSAAANQVWGQTISSVAGSVAGSIGGAIKEWVDSDVELKENIEQVGTSPSGLNIYEWNYIGDSDRYRGVIAQDLLNKGRHDAVTKGDNGYLAVYYDKIDVNMQKI